MTEHPATDVRRPWWRKLDLKGPDGKPFLRRRGFDLRRGGGILLHRIDGPDPGLDLHDHPWWFVTLILRGGYIDEQSQVREAIEFAQSAEQFELVDGEPRGSVPRGVRRRWRRWSVHRMPLHVAHRIVHADPGTVTLVIRGPKVRRWGFYMPSGWIDWDQYDYPARRPLAAESNRPGEDRPLPGDGDA